MSKELKCIVSMMSFKNTLNILKEFISKNLALFSVIKIVEEFCWSLQLFHVQDTWVFNEFFKMLQFIFILWQWSMNTVNLNLINIA